MLKKLNNILKKIEEGILAYGIISISFLIVANVIMRYLFKKSWTPTEEICILIVIVSTFIGASYASRHGSHLSMSALFDFEFISKSKKKILLILISIITCIFSIIIGYYGLIYAIQNYIVGRVTPSLGIPLYIINASFTIGFWLMAIQFIRNIIVNLKSDELHVGPEKNPNEELM